MTMMKTMMVKIGGVVGQVCDCDNDVDGEDYDYDVDDDVDGDDGEQQGRQVELLGKSVIVTTKVMMKTTYDDGDDGEADADADAHPGEHAGANADAAHQAGLVHCI